MVYRYFCYIYKIRLPNYGIDHDVQDQVGTAIGFGNLYFSTRKIFLDWTEYEL